MNEIDDKLKNIIILADLGRIKQILNNLLSNALKFTYGGFIKIKFDFNNPMSFQRG